MDTLFEWKDEVIETQEAVAGRLIERYIASSSSTKLSIIEETVAACSNSQFYQHVYHDTGQTDRGYMQFDDDTMGRY